MLDRAMFDTGDPAGQSTFVAFPLRKCVKRSAAAGKPAEANPSATLLPRILSAANLALSHPAFGVCACVSWLPLGSTGRAPATVKANAAAAEGPAAAAADPAAGGDPAADGAAEHPGSAATMHRNAAQVTGSFVRIWPRRRIARASHGCLRADQTAYASPGPRARRAPRRNPSARHGSTRAPVLLPGGLAA